MDHLKLECQTQCNPSLNIYTCMRAYVTVEQVPMQNQFFVETAERNKKPHLNAPLGSFIPLKKAYNLPLEHI